MLINHFSGLSFDVKLTVKYRDKLSMSIIRYLKALEIHTITAFYWELIIA